MTRLLALIIIVAALALPAPAHAAVIEWDAGIPKQGTEGHLRCIGEATVGDTTYRNLNWIGFDADEPADSEAAWQRDYCRRTATESVRNWFRYQRGVDLPESAVRVTMRYAP